MPHTPLRELKPELFENEYKTDSEGGGTDSDGKFTISLKMSSDRNHM